MILTCPECSTRYLTKESAIGENGRTVRCVKCETTWFVSPHLDAAELRDNSVSDVNIMASAMDDNADTAARVPDKTSETHFGSGEAEPREIPNPRGAHIEMRNRDDKKRRNKNRFAVFFIWGTTLFLIVLATIIAFLNRQEIVDYLPKTATLYKALGITVSETGLDFERPITRTVFIDNEPVLIVNGAIENISTRQVDIPLISLSLHNRASEVLAEWRIELSQTHITSGGRLEYVTQYPNPPIDAVSLRYSFVDPLTNMNNGPSQMTVPMEIDDHVDGLAVDAG